MTLASGTRLGSYEIRGVLGAGGMGEVYRAQDTKLKREVAIKVLPEEFARNEERMKRFDREAQLLASLNHPSIAAIYGVEETNGVKALVLELVEGPTLAERIAEGPMPLNEALPIARQIAQGLEAAHERAVIHRDLKPANVKLTKSGDVKILDFGLAKALEAEEDRSGGTSSPTLTRAATRAGVLLGTAAYMSPEQAQGKPADRRADVWAFGVVLYEMLAGRSAFAGGDVSETIPYVLTKEPDWSALPRGLPAQVHHLLERCLVKDPRKRLQAIGEARIALEDASAGKPDAPAPSTRANSVYGGALAGAVGLALGVGATLAALSLRPSAPPASPVRLKVGIGAHLSLVSGRDERRGALTVLSPDGAHIVFVGRERLEDAPKLYVRPLEHLEASPLPGTEDARNPFFSPDGQWIAYFADGKLKKVARTGGAPITLCDAPDNRGGTWSEDGTIVFAPSTNTGLSRVSSAGGIPEVLTKLDPDDGEVTHRWPQVLPGGKAVVYTTSTTSGGFDDGSIVAQTLPNGPKEILVRGGYHGRYVPSGHLVYMHQGTLFAAAFDLGRLAMIGPAAPAVEGVTTSTVTAAAQFAFSDRGDLVYLPGASTGAEFSIDWMDSSGKTEPLRAVADYGNLQDYGNLRFSPDGGRLAIDIGDAQQGDVWIYDWSRDTLSRLTFDPGNDRQPIWAPHEQRIAFASDRARKGAPNLYWQRADGTGEAERLTESSNVQIPRSWHPSGKFLAFFEGKPQTNRDIMILPIEGDRASGWKAGSPSVFLGTPSIEDSPEFSPDGRWIAYQSNESGRFEVYVRPFPGPGGKWQASTEGGGVPIWSRSSPELLYLADNDRIMSVRYRTEDDQFLADKARPWSEARVYTRKMDLYPDGRRVAVLRGRESADAERDSVVFILKFFDYLHQIAPAQAVN